MFVFWYCHKRGKETRLARSSADGKDDAEDGEDDEVDAESTDDEELAAKANTSDKATLESAGKENEKTS
jgi:hypothetical protein